MHTFLLEYFPDYEAKISQPSLRAQLEERLVSMPDSESYYLLTTFANMALCRHNYDWAFIRAATLDLLQVQKCKLQYLHGFS